jgi:hypothetical protein
MKAANVTDSWIITAGIKEGVSKLGKSYFLFATNINYLNYRK